MAEPNPNTTTEQDMHRGIAMLDKMQMSPPIGVGDLTFVTCLRCGAMVLLVNSLPGLTNGGPTPVDQHHQWHAAQEKGVHL